MKPLNLILFFALLSTYTHVAQVGIGTTTPNASLEIQASNVASPANTDGLLIPKVDEFPATNPTVSQDGMLVFATGNGSVTKGFYFWNNGTSNWDILSGSSIQQINDLTDGRSDNDGSNDGSSIFLGINSGVNDDATNNSNVAIGFSSMQNNISGSANTAIGGFSMLNNTTGVENSAFGRTALASNTTGAQNVAVGSLALVNNEVGSNNTGVGRSALGANDSGSANTAIGNYAMFNITAGSNNTALGANAGRLTYGNNNVFIGNDTGANNIDTKSGSVFIGYQAGYDESNSNRLYIENSSSTTPLIYGEFDNDFLRVNGDAEIEKATDAGLAVVTPFGFESSLKLFERGSSGDFGFEFEYDGSPDKLYLWSRRFAGNEGIRMTWLKDGRVGIGTTSPYAKLDLEASNAASPSTTDGFLVPRIDAFPSTNPGANQNGMLVFLNTDNSFYYWNNSTTSWVNIVSASSAVGSINDLADGRSDNDGSDNGSSVFLGVNAGSNDDQTNNENVGIGYTALSNNISGNRNTAVGNSSLSSNTNGLANTAVGEESLSLNTTGRYNTALGSNALQDNETAWQNTGVGFNALGNNTTGPANTAFGSNSLPINTTGQENVAVGFSSLYVNNTGNYNTALGSQALYGNSTGDYNTAVGFATSGSNNYSNTTAIGYNADPNSSNQVRLGNASVAIIGGNANWSVFSDERVKTNIREDIVGLEFIKRLRPVSYNYDMDAIARLEKTPDSLRLKNAEGLKAAEVQNGFIAQEVEAAATAAGFDFHGVIKPERADQPYALRYSEFVVPIVKAVQEQQAIIDAQAVEIEALRREIEQIKLLLEND
ncbi:tail fiber domain-containing protein [Gilvibacter sp.]|uniref:tail fiber domain-containing protein n=1 Tax=Gilvibacter sp. TaxID=2729997 RepID=UPI003F4A3C2C